jgi:outer membrane protein OmpA-like peptidoglycan-associated protein
MVVRIMCILVAAVAMQASDVRFGLFGGAAFTSHRAFLTSNPGFVCCDTFQKTNSTTGLFGLLAESSITPNVMLGIKAGWWNTSATFSQVLGNASIKNQLLISGEQLFLEANAGLRIEEIGLLTVGVMWGYTQPHSFTSVTVPNTAPQVLASGRFPFVPQQQLAYTMALGIDIPVGIPQVALRAQGFARVNASAHLINAAWNMYAMGASLSLVFTVPFSPTTEQVGTTEHSIVQPENVPTIARKAVQQTRTYALRVTGEEFVTDTAGMPISLQKVYVEEFESLQHIPMVPYVFFENQQHTIPARYTTVHSATEQPYSSALAAHHGIFTIVANRMRGYPQAIITLTGTTSADSGRERTVTIAKQRAESVKRVLMELGVPARQIVTAAQLLPTIPSGSTAEGKEENRRVEITCSEPEILSMVVQRRVLYVVKPSALLVHSIATATAERRLRAKVFVGADFEQRLEIAPERSSVMCMISEKNVHHLDSVCVALLVGEPWVTVQQQCIPIEIVRLQQKQQQRVGDTQYSEFSLILFEFNKALVGKNALPIITAIRQVITPESAVEIIGSTDNVGNASKNLELSEQRAYAVADALGVPDALISGTGEEQPPVENSTPEGRMINRTVRIVVRTPVAAP